MTRTEYHPYELAVEELTTENYRQHLDSLNGTIAQLRAEIAVLQERVRQCRCGIYTSASKAPR